MKAIKTMVYAALVSVSFGAQGQTLCSDTEASIFSCEIGKKVLSVCTSKDLDDQKGWMQYRFGTAEKLDLIFPEKNEHPKKHFKSNRLYSSVEQSLIQELQFKRSTTGYTVYTQEVRGRKEAGVVVTANGKDTTLKCKSVKGTADFSSKVDELGLDPVE